MAGPESTFTNDPLDIEDLAAVLRISEAHPPAPTFEAAIFSGPLWMPRRIDLFDEPNPNYRGVPLAVYYLDAATGQYTTGVTR